MFLLHYPALVRTTPVMDTCTCAFTDHGCLHKSILNAIPEMVLVQDGNDKVVFINAPLAKSIGVDSIESLGVTQHVPVCDKDRGSMIVLDKHGNKHFFYITSSSNVAGSMHTVHLLKLPGDKYELINQYFDSLPYKMGITTLGGENESNVTPILQNEETRKALNYQPLKLVEWNEMARLDIVTALKQSRSLGYVL